VEEFGCLRDVPLVATVGSETATVGFLRAGTAMRGRGGETAGGTTAVELDWVSPSPGALLAVRTSDVAGCSTPACDFECRRRRLLEKIGPSRE
jgi:hypothetical protein